MMNNFSDEQNRALRSTYALIDLNNLEYNVNMAKKLSDSDIIAIVKANAYGHGVREVSRHLYNKCDVRYFGVATIEEGMELREVLEDWPAKIMVLGYIDRQFYPEMLSAGIIPTVFNYSAADELHKFLEESKSIVPVTIKIDTGMKRLGFLPDMNLAHFAEKYPRFEIEHVMSHFSSSDDSDEYSEFQESQFNYFVTRFNDMGYKASLYNSSAIAKYSNHFELTRPGLFMYGYVNGVDMPLKPVMSIYSKVVHVQKILRGESISYGRRYTAAEDCYVGTVPMGYADGYCRSFTNNSKMYINGVMCPVIGTVCMDMTMIDVTPFAEKALGKEVEVLGQHINATELAKNVNTIEYELLCGFSKRIPRIYKNR